PCAPGAVTHALPLPMRGGPPGPAGRPALLPGGVPPPGPTGPHAPHTPPAPSPAAPGVPATPGARAPTGGAPADATAGGGAPTGPPGGATGPTGGPAHDVRLQGDRLTGRVTGGPVAEVLAPIAGQSNAEIRGSG